MKDLPSLNRLQSNSDSFRNVSQVNISNVPNCNSIRLHHAFMRVSMSNYQCYNCSRVLLVQGVALNIVADVLSYLLDLSRHGLNDRDAVELLDDCILTFEKYDDLDVYHDRLTIVNDCKNVISKLDNALDMDRNYLSNTINSNERNLATQLAKFNGKMGLGVAAAAGGALLLAVNPLLAVGLIVAGTVNNANADDDKIREIRTSIENLKAKCDSVDSYKSRLSSLRSRYSKYFLVVYCKLLLHHTVIFGTVGRPENRTRNNHFIPDFWNSNIQDSLFLIIHYSVYLVLFYLQNSILIIYYKL